MASFLCYFIAVFFRSFFNFIMERHEHVVFKNKKAVFLIKIWQKDNINHCDLPLLLDLHNENYS